MVGGRWSVIVGMGVGNGRLEMVLFVYVNSYRWAISESQLPSMWPCESEIVLDACNITLDTESSVVAEIEQRTGHD